jgi:hypothetical protein
MISCILIRPQGHLYAIGGNDGISSLDKCERYEPFLNKWTAIANMQKRRAGAGCSVLDGFIYVVGKWRRRRMKIFSFLDLIHFASL